MKKSQKFTLPLVFCMLIGSAVRAEECQVTTAESRAKGAALAVESISAEGPAAPLTTEIYSLSSNLDTWGVILSYSGVQKFYRVSVGSEDCQVKKVILSK